MLFRLYDGCQFFDRTEVRKQTSGIKNEDYFEKGKVNLTGLAP